MPKVCYVCCIYFGKRRCSIEDYEKDPLIFLKEQISSLQEFKHDLDRIVFVFNLDKDHLDLFFQAKKLIPESIQKSKVETIIRDNVGMSYGAWSDAFVKYQSEFDYYIFNEDDYFMNDHGFDKYMVEKFESYHNIGYLAGVVMNPAPQWPNEPPHAGNSIGISSYKVLNELYQKFGCLPHPASPKENLQERYFDADREGQVSQTYEIFKLGYNLYDVRDDYNIPHYMGPYLKKQYPESEHFLDVFFPWNEKSLVYPGPMRLNKDGVFMIYIQDPQYSRKRSCYVVNFYFGPRRRTVEDYQTDRLCFLKKQIETLTKYSHNLSKVIFTINADPSQYEYVNEAIKITPKKIRNTVIEVVVRENKGFSYAAFSDAFAKNRDSFDYFIFNEDDYFLVDHNWDEYLIRKYNQLPNTGYLTALQRDEDESWNEGKIHAGHCFGIASTQNLNRVWEEYGCLPHVNVNDYVQQEKVQIEFTYAFVKLGMRVYDIREEYRLAFAMTEQDDQDIWRWWWWNEKDLIIPAIIAFNKPYTWWESFDGPCLRKTNLEKYTQ